MSLLMNAAVDTTSSLTVWNLIHLAANPQVPSAVYNLLYVVCCLLSAVCCLLSSLTVWNLIHLTSDPEVPSAVCCLLSAVKRVRLFSRIIV
jgi:hypothetical protein